MEYTTTEAAAVLGVKPRTVTHYIERGLIIATKKGRDFFITSEEIQRFAATRRGVGKPKKEAVQ